MAFIQILKKISQLSPCCSAGRRIFLLPLVLLTISLCPSGSVAKSLVSGQYSSSSGNRIILNLNISKPAPANLIVEQYLSAKNTIVSTSPHAKKRSAGKLKWLFRNTAVGRLTISIQLQSSLKGKIRGVVRYRDPISGSFVETRISP